MSAPGVVTSKQLPKPHLLYYYCPSNKGRSVFIQGQCFLQNCYLFNPDC